MQFTRVSRSMTTLEMGASSDVLRNCQPHPPCELAPNHSREFVRPSVVSSASSVTSMILLVEPPCCVGADGSLRHVHHWAHVAQSHSHELRLVPAA